jgi:hypothetical protein
MSHALHGDPSPPSGFQPRNGAQVVKCWPRVQVTSAEITTGATAACARAILQLGGLTRADVRVELMPAEPAEGPVTTPHEGERRMFSELALANGCFVFETTLPHRDSAAPRDWLIHVHPSEAIDEPRVDFRFFG